MFHFDWWGYHVKGTYGGETVSEYPNVLYVQDASRAVGVVSLLGERGNTLESAQVQYATFVKKSESYKKGLASIEKPEQWLSIDFSEEPQYIQTDGCGLYSGCRDLGCVY